MKKIKLLGAGFLVLAVSFLGFSGSLAQAATTYTLADVATHNTSTNCWVAISGNVYNLTAFIPTHPGGAAAIIGLCGTDGTAALSAAPHGLSVVPTIASYMIGALVTSTTPVLTSVSIVASSSSIIIGGTSQLAATPKDQNGTLFVGATTTFTSGTPAVATVDSTTGLVTGVTAGTSVITATSVSGTTSVSSTTTITVTTVAVTPVLTSVTVTPATSSIAVAGTTTLTASPKDQNGAAFVGATTTFSSSAPTIATVNSTTGVVTGVAAGTATITATSISGTKTVTGTAMVTITTRTGGGGDDQNENENEGSGTGGHHTGGGSGEHEGGGTGTGTGGHSHGSDD